MQQQIIQVHKRYPCNHCLQTLNPHNSDPDLRMFVRCFSCGHIIHQSCYAKTRICPVCSSANLCGITLVGSLPPLKTPMRLALGFDENQSPDLRPNLYTKYIVAGIAVLFLFVCISIVIALAAITTVLPNMFPRSATASLPR